MERRTHGDRLKDIEADIDLIGRKLVELINALKSSGVIETHRDKPNLKLVVNKD